MKCSHNKWLEHRMIKSHSLLHFCFVSSIIILQLVETSYGQLGHVSIASVPGLPLYAPRKRGITLTSQIVVKFISGGGGCFDLHPGRVSEARAREGSSASTVRGTGLHPIPGASTGPGTSKGASWEIYGSGTGVGLAAHAPLPAHHSHLSAF